MSGQAVVFAVFYTCVHATHGPDKVLFGIV